MKRIVFWMIAMILCSHLFAQNKKGNWIVGTGIGTTGFSSEGSKFSSPSDPIVRMSDQTSFYVSINPSAGKFVTDRVVVGGSVVIAPYSSKTTNSSTATTNTSERKTRYLSLSAGPFARFYMNSKNPKGAAYIHINTGISFFPGYKATGSSYETTLDEYTSWNAGASFGYEHFLNSAIGFYYSLGYMYSHTKEAYTTDFSSTPSESSTDEFHSHEVTLSLGLTVHLASLRKK